MSNYVIGDVQGCDEELGELLDLIRFKPDQDRVFFVGDLVNRGPHSLPVLRRVKALQEQGVAEAVLGNHDFFLLMLHAGLAKQGAADTLQTTLNAGDIDELITWLRHRPLLLEVDGAIIVHAGLLPAWTIDLAKSVAQSIEKKLRKDDYIDFLTKIWGNEPRTWFDDLRGMERKRIAVNALARLRFCSTDSTIELKHKRDASTAPAGYAPWFRLPNNRFAGTPIISGHWSSEGLRLWPNGNSMLDSGCLWGGALTALRLHDRAIFQIPGHQPLNLLGGD